MKLNDKDIDQLFKDKLKNIEFEITDSFLSDIEYKLPERKSNKVLALLFGLLAGVLFFGFFYISSFEKPDSKTTKQKEYSHKTKKTFFKATPKNKNSQYNKKYLSKTSNTTNHLTPNKSTESSNGKKITSTQNNTLHYKNETTPVNYSTTSKLTYKPINKRNKYATITTNSGVNKSTNLQQKDEIVQEKNSIEKTLLVETQKNDKESPSKETIDTTKITDKIVVVQNETPDNIKIETEVMPKQVRFLLNLDVGYNFNSAVYSGKESNYYKVNNSEYNKNSYQFDANLLLKNKFLLGTGVGLQKFSNSYEFTTSIVNYDTITQLVDSTYVLDYYIYGNPPQNTIIIDSVYSYQYVYQDNIDSTIISLKTNGINEVSYLRIPLNIGYVFTYKKFLMDIEANFRYNILLNTSGSYYTNNTIVNFDKNTNQMYKKSYFDTSFKLGIHYNLWQKLYINTAVRYTPRINSIYNLPGVDKKIQTINTSIGLSYLF